MPTFTQVETLGSCPNFTEVQILGGSTQPGVDVSLIGLQGPPGPQGRGFVIDAQGLLATRNTYDPENVGFTFFATDTGDLYFRETATDGVWSLPVPFGGSGTYVPISEKDAPSGIPTLNADSELTLINGGTIAASDVGDGSITLTPPNAIAGQALLIRPTANPGILNDVGFAPGATINITLYDGGTGIRLDKTGDGGNDGSWPFTITGITSQQLGSPLTGSFLSADWDPGNNYTNTITFTIPGNSTGTGFTITLDDTIDSVIYNNWTPTPPQTNPLSLTVGTVPGVAETGHLHLTAEDPVNIDLIVGSDDQYVKIVKDDGGVVIATDGNSNQWTFTPGGDLEIPIGGDITQDGVSVISGGGGGGSSTLAGLTDVDTTLKVDTSVLYYKSSVSKFVADDVNTIITLIDGGNF